MTPSKRVTTATLSFPRSATAPTTGADRIGDGGRVSERVVDGAEGSGVVGGIRTGANDDVRLAEGASSEVLAERSLVLAAQDGSDTAFAGLVHRHQRRAYAVARSIVLTHDDAEDAVQEGFLHAWRALARFRPEQAFGAWLHRIVANAALDIARRKKVRDADELQESVSSPFHDPAVRAELRGRLGLALSQLPERQRSVLVLHDVEGYKHSEIGQTLGIPEGTARSDLHHARAALRRLLGNLRRDS
jgi:RNA polymerase sigma-70 factor (ECF subfamily)